MRTPLNRLILRSCLLPPTRLLLLPAPPARAQDGKPVWAFHMGFWNSQDCWDRQAGVLDDQPQLGRYASSPANATGRRPWTRFGRSSRPGRAGHRPPLPPDVASGGGTLSREADKRQVIQFNPGAALQQRIFADGFVPNSPEFRSSSPGSEHAAQRAEHLGSGEVRVYFAPASDVGRVDFERRTGGAAR